MVMKFNAALNSMLQLCQYGVDSPGVTVACTREQRGQLHARDVARKCVCVCVCACVCVCVRERERERERVLGTRKCSTRMRRVMVLGRGFLGHNTSESDGRVRLYLSVRA